jgi:hypothetical protein
MSKNILIISDGIPGHVNQSRGMATLLGTKFELSVIEVELKYKSYFFRSPIQIISRFMCRIMNNFSAKVIMSLHQAIEVNDYDLIIAAGGNTASISAAMKNKYSIPVVQLGSPRKGINPNLFNVLITVEKYFDHYANVVTDITPNLYSPLICSTAAKQEMVVEHYLYLIGGTGIGYSYNSEEWDKLISNIIKINKSDNIPISIVTSRRTDPSVERKLATQLSDFDISASVWFHKGDQDFNLAALLGAANKVFVTEDSAMMISESISSGKPVTTLYPSKINSPLRYKKHIQKYEDLKYITRQPITSFTNNFFNDSHQKIEKNQNKLLTAITKRVNW